MLEVAVIGVPDERLQEEIMAIIVRKEGSIISKNEIISLCEKNLARFKKPRYIEFIDELPKNASGKILKLDLRKKFETLPLPSKL
ncbi:hypothetical protein ACFL7M_11830 [Thermodesulfobacteriota bacterium]